MSLTTLINQMVLDEALKSAEPLAKQLGLDSVPDDMLEMICLNLGYSGEFTPGLYRKFQLVKRLLTELSEQTTPKHGHLVKFTYQYGTHDESSLLFRERNVRGQDMVCCVGGKNIDDIVSLQSYGLDMHIGTGGPFEPITREQIQAMSVFDFYDTNYSFWGSRPCGNGMLTVNVPMKRWHLDLTK